MTPLRTTLPVSEWLTWGTYDSADRPAAYVAASSLRLGKVAAIKALGPVDARVQNVDGKVNVRVARKD